MSDLHKLVVEAQAIAGAHPCAVFGHQWASAGGRLCAHADNGCNHPDARLVSQTVYQCIRCEEYDYGEPGGPGYDDCVRYCGLQAVQNGR